MRRWCLGRFWMFLGHVYRPPVKLCIFCGEPLPKKVEKK